MVVPLLEEGGCCYNKRATAIQSASGASDCEKGLVVVCVFLLAIPCFAVLFSQRNVENLGNIQPNLFHNLAFRSVC